MVLDWLEQQGILMKEEHGKVKLFFQNASYTLDKASLEDLNIQESISLYDEIIAALSPTDNPK